MRPEISEIASCQAIKGAQCAALKNSPKRRRPQPRWQEKYATFFTQKFGRVPVRHAPGVTSSSTIITIWKYSAAEVTPPIHLGRPKCPKRPAPRRLRARRERIRAAPDRRPGARAPARTAEQRDELAPPHSITSSTVAFAGTVGTVRTPFSDGGSASIGLTTPLSAGRIEDEQFAGSPRGPTRRSRSSAAARRHRPAH